MIAVPANIRGMDAIRAFLSLLVLALAGCSSAERSPEPTSGSGPPSSGAAPISAERLYDGLSPAEVTLAGQTVQSALETALSKQNRSWSGARNGTYGFVTPLRTFRITTGFFCREYLETVATGAGVVSATKTACRDDDGIWKEAELIR